LISRARPASRQGFDASVCRVVDAGALSSTISCEANPPESCYSSDVDGNVDGAGTAVTPMVIRARPAIHEIHEVHGLHEVHEVHEVGAVHEVRVPSISSANVSVDGDVGDVDHCEL